MTRRAQLEAEHEVALEVADLEDELVKLKASGKTPDRLREVKDRLRELRCVLRLGRDGFSIDATTTPATIVATSAVSEV